MKKIFLASLFYLPVALMAADSQEVAERSVLLRDISALRAELAMPPLPSDTSKLTLEALRAEQAMLAGVRAEKREAESREKIAQEAKRRQAEAAVKSGAAAITPASRMQAPPLTEAQLIELKKKFPPAEKRRVSVLIQNAKRKSREDIIEVEIPPRDLWADLHGDISTASLSSLPTVLARIDEKIEAARRQARGAAADYRWGFAGGQSGEAQARYTAEWLEQVLKPYLAKLRR